MQMGLTYQTTITKKGIIIMKIIKQCYNFLMLIFGIHTEATRRAVDENVCDFSGQGRDKYGK